VLISKKSQSVLYAGVGGDQAWSRLWCIGRLRERGVAATHGMRPEVGFDT
jgi:hypothetical protein